ncbi:hypothetical protein SAMN05428959_106305 [Duganella sp. CF517]|uniref:hypothetical protein n=1 Tax=Duganella sp. CF517 TaxID=1881038 RepID=UPI0008B27961|nr:hypothetical protein [Duganella sp. CF517]SEO32283.1 hypothetical protein SAMN05428959_106305 [Duganella sp. CF517]
MPRTLFLAVVLAAAGPSDAAITPDAFNKVAPPPGLYRIDSDASMRMAPDSATVRHQLDGASGKLDVTATEPGKSPQRIYNGASGQKPYCLPPRNGKAQILPPEMAASACKNISESITDTTLTTESQCAIGKVKITIRKLGNDRWEMTHESDTKTSPAASNINAMRPMLENAARNASTAEARAQARQMLADLPRQQAEMQAALAKTRADLLTEQASASSAAEKAEIAKQLQALDQGGPGMHATSRSLWTRIGGSCAAR